MNWPDFCKKVSELSDKLQKLDSELEHGENFNDAFRREHGGEIKSNDYELYFWDSFEGNKKYFGVPRKIMAKAINDAKADLFEQIYEVENELLMLVQEQANEN
ncbi:MULTISPECIES: hypothetical protein [Enterococcus]|uniref:hypothetical protein n=1 Tax=Enterococcus TaxID=1350 RepID=UPI00119CC4D3|nr:hypothetical protein [Enterococcus casseliflavus]MDO7872682.1 hypothetical protein [Enterococcus casseliflavus]